MKRSNHVFGIAVTVAAIIASASSAAMAQQNYSFYAGFEPQQKTGGQAKTPNNKAKAADRTAAFPLAVDLAALQTLNTRLADTGNSIGITIAPTDAVLRSQLGLKKGSYGVVVTGVLAKSPAAKAGVHEHDIILSATGTGIAAGSDLTSVIRKAGKKPLALKVLRAGKTYSFKIQPAPVNNANIWRTNRLHVDFAPSSKYMVGVQTKAADAELIAQLVLPPATGRVVTNVTAKSPAEAAGLQKYDVILKAGDAYLKSSSDLSKAIDDAKGKPVQIEFIRAGRKQTGTVKPILRPKRISIHEDHLLWIAPKLIRGQQGVYDLGVHMNYPVPHTIVWSPQHAGSVDSQIESMTKQLTAMQSSLDRLKATLATMKKHPKTMDLLKNTKKK